MVSIIIFFIISMIWYGEAQNPDCGSANFPMKFRRVTISPPPPIRRPSNITINCEVTLSQDMQPPIQMKITMWTKVLLFWVEVPCTNNVGSCTYSDWCTFCPVCPPFSCAITASTTLVSIPMVVSTTVPSGEYAAQVDFTSRTGQRGCGYMEGLRLT